MRRAFALLCCLIAASTAPAIALAATAVQLRVSPVSHGPNITLGDVFDGVDGAAAAVVIARAAQPGLDAVLDAGSVQLTARRAGLDWDNVSGFHRIVVGSQPGEAEPAAAHGPHVKSGRRAHAAQALTYARNLMAGEILNAEDLIWSDDALAPSDGVSDPDAAIGKAARHALRAGAPAAAHDLAAPRVIKRDDVVAVTFEADGVSLTLQAKAMGDASIGDALEVVNPTSKKVLETVCSGPDQALVGPRAEDLKAASYQPGGQGRLVTASLR